MKPPEIIFLHGYSFNDKPCKNWTPKPLKQGLRGHQIQHAKYIREDVLIEWAKEMKNINLEEADEKNDTFSYGIATGFAAMIDKLNSM